jgi:molybdenum cofactor cytidylyltransferase
MGERNKALLELGGKSFLATIAGCCRAASIQEIVVVVAEPHLAETKAAAADLGLAWVCNDHPEAGMASSVALAFDYAGKNFQAGDCWLWPVDVPAIPEGLLKSLASQRRPDSVVIPCFEDRGGHPVLVARSLWKELADCSQAPEGARTVFRRDPNRVVRVPVDHEGVRLDVDKPEDLLRIAGGLTE